jgi:hypothetical protein
MPDPARRGASLPRYLREAFLFRWNLLAFMGGVAAAGLSPFPDVLLPLVGALELAYLAGLVSIPRFRAAIDAKAAKGWRLGRAADAPSVETLLLNLPRASQQRFDALRARCLRMRAIAQGVRGRSGTGGGAADEVGTDALDRMLWVFLRLLHSHHALTNFLHATPEADLAARVTELEQQLARTTGSGDDRIERSLRDSLETARARLDNHRRGKDNERFVSIELDRIEEKIQALSEAAVNRQDPDFITSQVDSVAESMRQTEHTLGQLQAITGLVEDLDEPPPILAAELEETRR